MIRVLLAEDSPTSRDLLLAILTSDPEVRVVGTAGDGADAVAMTIKLKPDVVLMDVHMPVMDGFEATRRIMTTSPTPIVIVSATIDVKEVSVSLRALQLGALTLLPKPSGPGAPDFADRASELISVVKTMAQVKVVRRWSERPGPVTTKARLGTNVPVSVVGIAASTGGPAALHSVLSALPADFRAPILVVQHIAPGFVEGLATWLDQASPLEVRVAKNGALLQPRTVYIAPDNSHLGVSKRGTVEISQTKPLGGFRPSASHLFESLAMAYRQGVVAVMLTGMGDDGVDGLRLVHQMGGHIVAQDEESSVVFGMPGAAVEAGLVDMKLPLNLMASHLKRLVLADGDSEGKRK